MQQLNAKDYHWAVGLLRSLEAADKAPQCTSGYAERGETRPCILIKSTPKKKPSMYSTSLKGFMAALANRMDEDGKPPA